MPPKLDFPASPTAGQKYPPLAVVGQPTYSWDGEKWTTIGGAAASGGASDAIPIMDGTGYPGTATPYSREDHVHPAQPTATAVEYIANSAPAKMLASGATWTAATAQTLSETAGTATPNLSLALDFIWTLGGAARTMGAITGGKPGQKGLIFILTGATGTITTWDSTWKFAGGVKPTQLVNAVDILSFVVGGDGTSMYCTYTQDFK